MGSQRFAMSKYSVARLFLESSLPRISSTALGIGHGRRSAVSGAHASCKDGSRKNAVGKECWRGGSLLVVVTSCDENGSWVSMCLVD